MGQEDELLQCKSYKCFDGSNYVDFESQDELHCNLGPIYLGSTISICAERRCTNESRAIERLTGTGSGTLAMEVIQRFQ
jgi:hypothetical protein